jgi:hypothetical protein
MIPKRSLACRAEAVLRPGQLREGARRLVTSVAQRRWMKKITGGKR